jgi:hypothetical protein
MAVRAEISMVALRHAAGFAAMTGLGAHVGVGVRRHVIPKLVWGLL